MSRVRECNLESAYEEGREMFVAGRSNMDYDARDNAGEKVNG